MIRATGQRSFGIDFSKKYPWYSETKRLITPQARARTQTQNSRADPFGTPCCIWRGTHRESSCGGVGFASRKRMGQFLSRSKGQSADALENSRPESDLWLIVGLGNPGPRYAKTRHNAGFMAVDWLSRDINVDTDRLQANCKVGRGRIGDTKVLLVKPMTFMNVSGEGVGKLSKYYGVDPNQIIVMYDDLDLPTGSVRIRKKGGHGGHNGMRSIIQHLGTNEFPRIKIGISRPPEGVSVVDHVLRPFAKEEQDAIDDAIETEVLPTLRAALQLGMDKALSGVRLDREGKPRRLPHQNGKMKNTSSTIKGAQENATSEEYKAMTS